MKDFKEVVESKIRWYRILYEDLEQKMDGLTMGGSYAAYLKGQQYVVNSTIEVFQDILTEVEREK